MTEKHTTKEAPRQTSKAKENYRKHERTELNRRLRRSGRQQLLSDKEL